MTSISFPKAPACEACRGNPATHFVALTCFSDWQFHCACTASINHCYYISIDRFFRTPASAVEWLAHLESKNGMDWASFISMMDRFRDDTGSYNVM